MFVDLLGGFLLEGPIGITAGCCDVGVEEGSYDGEINEGGGRLGEGAIEAEVGGALGGGGGGEGGRVEGGGDAGEVTEVGEGDGG